MSNLEVKGSELHFGEGTAKHVLTINNGVPVLHRFTEKGKEAIDMSSATARSKLDAIIAAAEKGDLHPDTRDFIHTNAKAFTHGLDKTKPLDAKKIEKIGKLEAAIDFAKNAEGLQALDESEMKVLRAGLLEHGELGERLMDKEVMKAAGIMGLEKAEITRLRADAKKLQELMKRPVGNERLINELLTRNHADAPALLASVDSKLLAEFDKLHGGDLLAHVTSLDSAIVAEADKLKGILNADNFKALEEDLATAKKGTDKAAIVEAERRMNAALKEVREITKTPEGKAAYQLILKDKDFAEELGNARKASSQLASHLDGTAKAATESAKAVSGDAKFFSLFHGETKLAEIASKKGVAVKELGFFQKLRPGKTALVAGAVALGGYAIAGMGNRGPSQNASQVAGRENEPALGGGRA